MNFNQLPCIVLHYSPGESFFYQAFNMGIAMTQISIDSQKEKHSNNQSKQLKLNQCPNLLNQSQNQLQLSSTQKIKKFVRKNHFKKDSEFRQKNQTKNRNLSSNTLKVYFKQLRDKCSETFLNLVKITNQHNLPITVEQFLDEMETQFSERATYISTDSILKLCNYPQNDELSKSISKVLRASLSHFYNYQVYIVHIRSPRTTRKIRQQQIKQGQGLIQKLLL